MANNDLAGIIGSKVAHVEGYMSREFGDATFKLTRVVFEDGRAVDVEGEHDMPYICTSDPDILAAFEDAAGDEDAE